MNKYYQFIKFSLVGVLNTVIYMLIYFILLKVQVNYLIANIIGYIAGMINGYFWNVVWVFKKYDSLKSSFIKFTIVNCFTLLLSEGFLYIFVEKFYFDKYFSQILTISIVVFINFIANKKWSFKV